MENIEKINKENIINEDNVIIEYNVLEDLFKSDIKNSEFKLKIKFEKDGKSGIKTGIGFIFNISNIKAFITN